MKIAPIPFDTTDWHAIAPTVHDGERGYAEWRTRAFGDVRIRLVTYSPGYLADHWCEKGHFIFVVHGTLVTELADGRVVALGAGHGYQVGDGAMAHRSRTDVGATLFIVD